jgi:bacillithiol system protein YtxJ
MHWRELNSEGGLEELISKSKDTPQVIFKHSNRCSISSVAFQRLQKAQTPSYIDFYLVDVIGHRDLSNKIARRFGVNHESPQVLVIRNGECIFDESHMGIHMDDIIEQAQAA